MGSNLKNFFKPTLFKIVFATVLLSIPAVAKFVAGTGYVFVEPGAAPIQTNIFAEILTWVQNFLFFPTNLLSPVTQFFWIDVIVLLLYVYVSACFASFLITRFQQTKKSGQIM